MPKKIEKLLPGKASGISNTYSQPKMNQEYKQAIMERISLYVDKLSSARAFTADKFEAVVAFYNYMLTPDVKAILSCTDEVTVRARAILLEKTTVYMNQLHDQRYWLLKAYPEQTDALEEMLKFLTGAPNENWPKPLRRSDRVREQVVERYNQSLMQSHKNISRGCDDIEFYTKLCINSARLAASKSTVGTSTVGTSTVGTSTVGTSKADAITYCPTATVTCKVLPRRSSRLMAKQQA
jgi:hypothetical protein